MASPNAFKTMFGEPFVFTNGVIYIARVYTREEAVAEINEQEDCGGDYTPEDLKPAFVRFGFPPGDMSGYDEVSVPCWYGPVPEGRGAMPVWQCGE